MNQIDIYGDEIQYSNYELKKLAEIFPSLDTKIDIKSFLSMPSRKNADRYIHSYFESRSKSNLFNDSIMSIVNGEYESRSIHMVTAFLLGCHFQREMKELFCSNIGNGQWEFEYLWFMCCLYHDTFSSVEDDNLLEITSTDGILPKIAGEVQRYTIYDGEILGVELPTPTYLREDIEKYFMYRLNDTDKCIDHGIVGGYVAFQKLVENYLNMRAENGGKDTFHTFLDEDFYNRILIWKKEQIEAFAYVADAIIAHNI